ncbi:MAG TPA: FkbM family methyltransferase, partial [Solirubrobacteraceae bacterium]|nr:FkbM family methyltransferase [Solirubrobacteraceae bacterium]
ELVRYCDVPRLRAESQQPSGWRSRGLRMAVQWLESGAISVQAGRGGSLLLDMGHVSLSHVQLGGMVFGDLETSVQEALVRHLGDGGVLYDIGANVGFFALLGARLAGRPDGLVYAFEPAPANVRAIQANATLNQMPNIVVVPRAVGARSGVARLQLVEDQSWSKLEEYGAHPETEQVIDVEMVSIDQWLGENGLRPPTVIKIDVEGAELAVVEGMRDTLAEHRPAIICELHETQREFVHAMEDLGYRTTNLDGAVPVEQTTGNLHALALPARPIG